MNSFFEHSFSRSSQSSYSRPWVSSSFNACGQTVTPSSHVSVSENKAVFPKAATASPTSTGLPTPRPSSSSPENLPSDVHGQKTIPSPHLAVEQKHPVSSRDVANHTISFPTPHQSLNSIGNRPLSFDSVLSRLKPLLDGTATMDGECKVTIVGVSSDVLDKLHAKSEASELPGWENLRCVGFLRFLVNLTTLKDRFLRKQAHCPLPHHRT